MTPGWRLERLGRAGTSGGLPVPRAERGGRCYCPFAIFPARAPQMPEEGALASRRLCHAGITVARPPSLNGDMSPRPAAVAAIGAACLLVGALSGCAAAASHSAGSSGAAFPISLPAVRTPPDRGTPVGVALVTAQRGFVASNIGYPTSVSSGVVMAGSAMISLTGDSGHSWKTVWSERGVYLGWMGITGSKVVATGMQYPTTGPGSESGSPVLLLGNEGGGTWRVVHPSVPSSYGGWGWAAVDWVSSTLAFASTAPSFTGSIPQPLVVSRDGGASWTTAHLPGGTSTGGVSATSDSTIFATGSVTKATSTCDGAVWESTDAGSLWSRLPGSCSPAPLYSVQFLNSRTGFAGGGQLPSFSQPPGRVLLGTTDGGASWSIASEQITPSQLASPIVQLHFITNELGTLITGGCDPGANGPCGGHVYTTADGGHSLHRTAQMGTELSAVGTQDLWVVDYRDPQISVSYDAGEEWSTLPGLGEVRIGAITFQSGSLVLSTSGGTYTSSDGGHHWAYIGTAAVVGYAPPNVVTLDGESVSVESARRSGPGTVVHLSAAGPVRLTAAVFATPGRGIVFGAGSQCLKPQIAPTPTTVYVTRDGGLKWRRTATLNMAVNQAAYTSSFAAAVGAADCHGEMAISGDGGLRWRVGAIPSSCQDPSLTAAGATWLTCATQGAQGFAYLASGSTSAPLQAKHRLQGLAKGARFVAAANGDLYAVGGDDGANVLWVSRDGGRKWRGTPLSLPAG